MIAQSPFAQVLLIADLAAIGWCGFQAVRALIGTPAAASLDELRGLLERAAYDLRQGWTEAAIDCIGRAQRLLSDPTEETQHVD